ncbi:hypothetical protein DYB32_002154 [Aphanomyces invadans]|uniref:RNA methyltransferase n=1 Tax=Aphanomyces invadans TaxID=157072 RepID=A0A3R6VQW9_9STRA|nr:hypothetical protein DYB32_002154 [Aphanomyces invadans]
MICRRYYAFRLGGAIEGKLEEDSRLTAFKKEWFEGKKALDIGCNSGDMTLEIGAYPFTCTLDNELTREDPSSNTVAVRFPYNVVFKRENIVLDRHTGKDYDVITWSVHPLSLSVTKWVHLFHGDDGLKQLFHLVYALLMPGGRFILEPQKWKSYYNRKHTNATTLANYDRIALRPKDFQEYLCATVGFTSVELLKVCSTSTHGFKRPIYLYTK